MSLKNDYLLHHSGRNQIGDPGQGPLPANLQSPAPTDFDQAMWAKHRELNDGLVREHGAAWLALFAGLSKKSVWSRLCPHGTPACSTFTSMAREYASFEEFLFFWMLKNKRRSLEMLGLSKADIDEVIGRFKVCGGYYVTYGHGKRSFGTL